MIRPAQCPAPVPDNVKHDTHNVAQSLDSVRANIRAHEQRYAREPGSVELLAVSKKKPVSAIKEAITAGQLAFGENYVDEAVEKILTINQPDLQWHYIGAIQSRKTAQIAQHFQWAHGVDRLKIATRLAQQRPPTMAPLNICLQVNLDNEPGKSGVSLAQVPALALACAELQGVTLRGLMAIPAPRHEQVEQRQVFAQLSKCLSSLQRDLPALDTLSMGMSADMEAAIAQGATIVRVGTAIFGAREP